MLACAHENARRHGDAGEVPAPAGPWAFAGTRPRPLVHLTADEETQARYDALAEKRTEGPLTLAELEELESLVRVNTFLGVLKVEAQAVLAKAV